MFNLCVGQENEGLKQCFKSVCVGQANGALKQCFNSVMWKKLIEFCNARVSEYSTKHAFRQTVGVLNQYFETPRIGGVTSFCYWSNQYRSWRRPEYIWTIIDHRRGEYTSPFLCFWEPGCGGLFILFTLSVSESTMKQRTSVFSLQISHPSWFPHPAAEPKLVRQFTLTYIDFLCLIQLSSRF
jgi:hypothetical protein